MKPGVNDAERFLAGLRSTGANKGAGEKLALAVSGGPDSLALLLLAHACLPGRIVAATVDHGLRTEAAEEAAFVARLCAQRDIPHATLKPDRPISGNIQSQARKARYALLEQWAWDAHQIIFIATAHHADDQLETLLMRLARGSGVAGMAGVRRRNGQIIRPLLDFTRAELEAICTGAGIEPRRDPGNDDERYDRVRFRHWLAAADHPLDPAAAVRTAGTMADADDALSWMTTQLEKDSLRYFIRDASVSGFLFNEYEGDKAVVILGNSYPFEIRRRLLSNALRRFGETKLRGEALARAVQQLQQGATLTIGNVLCRGGVNNWLLTPAPPRKN